MHIFEAILSAIIPGLGQIIKGETSKGVLLILLFYFALPATAYLSLLINPVAFLYVLAFAIISGIILWVWAVADALIKT